MNASESLASSSSVLGDSYVELDNSPSLNASASSAFVSGSSSQAAPSSSLQPEPEPGTRLQDAAESSMSTPRLESVQLPLDLERQGLIREAVKRRDMPLLRQLAVQPGGFQTDELRRLVW
jgi:hypothetical protein